MRRRIIMTMALLGLLAGTYGKRGRGPPIVPACPVTDN